MNDIPRMPIRKIAVLLPSAQAGGAEQMVFEELSFLKHDRRFQFELHLVFEAGSWCDKFKALEIPVHVWNTPHKSPRMLLNYFNIVRYLRRERFDILHIHLLNYLGPWAGRLAGLKVITTVHVDFMYRLLERICLRQSDLLFGCGSQVMRNLKGFIPEKKLKLLNNAIRVVLSSGLQPENILERFGLYKDSRVVLSLGRYTEQKGYDLLVEAFGRVVKKEPKAVLLIGGDGPDREKLERQVMAKGMQESIHLLGLVNDVDALFEICDIYVNSSRWEGLPVSLLEAMAHKKPIVATNVGGNSEIIKNGETGLLVPPERPDLISEAILKVFEDRSLAGRLGAKAFELFKEHYSINKHCAILASEYLA